LNDAPAFICILAILQANRIFVWALPFGSAAWAGGFVFVAPDFDFGAAYVTVDVGGLWLKQIT
jgi:hypothetical protein